MVGVGLVGMAAAAALQEWASVTAVDEGFFPGMGETVKALGVIRRRYDREPWSRYAATTWAFALAQDAHPKSPVRLLKVEQDGEADAAAFLDHMLLLDAYLFAFRRRGGALRVQTEVVHLDTEAGRVRRVITAKGETLETDAVVIAPGTRIGSLQLAGLPRALAASFTPVQDVIVPFRLPPGHRGPLAIQRGVRTIWPYTILAGLRRQRVLVSLRQVGRWYDPSFDDLVDAVARMQADLDVPGEAEVDQVKTCRDLSGPDGRPFVGPIVSLGGPAGVYVAAGMGLEGLSLAGGVAAELSHMVARDLS